MPPLLILDTNYLCHRAFHALGHLTFEDLTTGCIFGVLRDILHLQELFATDHIVFTFDHPGHNLRRDLLPGYKSTRYKRHEDEDDETRRVRIGFYEQVDLLRTKYLHDIGFRNVFSEEGFEADDIIASITKALHKDREAIIVSSDQDLWQLVGKNVWCHNPQTNRSVTNESFRAKWGIRPKQWAAVKALAGCSTDDIPGIRGVGELTAAKFLAGNLPRTYQAYRNIMQNNDTFDRNLELVLLPLKGTPTFELKKDCVTQGKWDALSCDLNMPSLQGRLARGPKKSKGRKRGNRKEEGFGLNHP